MSTPAGWRKGLPMAVAGMSLVLCLAGGVDLARGIAVPVSAGIAQHRLERVFEKRLAAGGASGTGDVERVQAPSCLSHRRHKHETSIVPVEGVAARISVERLGIREIVLAGDGTHEQLAEGPVMLKRGDEASPVTILAAHRDTHFLFIRDLREGDEVTMRYVDGSQERYRITRFETVRRDRFTYPMDPARPLLALTTCFPFGGTEYGGPWRRVAWGERIS